MNINRILIAFLALIAATSTVSCHKDRGNYDHLTLAPMEIDVEGVPQSYTLLRFDTLTIRPKVRYGGVTVDPADAKLPQLEFSWEMYPAQIDREIIERHTLSDSIALHAEMNQRELTWEVLFTVTDKETGVKAFSKFNVAITPALAEGWMVLYERNGATDVGIISNNDISKTQVAERVFMDVYSASNGAPLRGTPGSIIYSTANMPGRMKLYVQSSEDIASINLNTFERVASFDDGLFWTRPAVAAPALVTATPSRKEFLINDNRLHVLDYTVIAPGDRAFNDALGGSYGMLAPWIATATSPAFEAILYDQTNQRFMKVMQRGSEVVPISTVQSEGTPFDVNEVGMELIFADLGWNNWEHMVMRDTYGGHYLLTANFMEGETAFIGKGKYDMNTCPDIGNINAIAAGYFGEVFYYSANASLYQFRYTPGATEMLWTAPEGQTITDIALQKYYNTNRAAGVLFDPKNLCRILYIATYNEATRTGTVYQMEVNPSSGAIIAGTEKSYSGFGKIKAMGWKPFL
ncbi:PKD-like family lipoprotein [Parapedobacter deserti]|uniref:PKD-like family lipoprotein n=1 Tax=Parapedobacter deserti TaxID=1912957 RepID=A0ABV7JG86_9SPHI